MFITKSILDSCLHELNICQHLHSKFDATNANWRPAENMRSTVELMQYLCYIGTAMSQHFVNAPTDHEEGRNNYRALSKLSRETVTFENFPEMIEREKEALHIAFARITDANLERMTYHMFTNEEMTLFDALMNSLLKYLCAYRHQLFLYAKMCGAEINTRNNWYGVDMPQPVKQAAAVV